MIKHLISLILPIFLLVDTALSQASVMEAADYLYETCFSQWYSDAQRVDTEGFQGYILSPLRDLGEPGGQQVAIEFRHYRTGESGEYYGFWLYENLVDYPKTGDGHCVTLNFYAVSTQPGGPILMQRTNWSEGLDKNDPKFDEAFDRELERWDHFWAVVDGEESLMESDSLIIN